MFRSLKEYLSKLSLLSKPIEGKPLYLYLAVTEYAISGALVREEGKVQWPVYYISKRLIDAKTRYLEMEKLALTLVIASRKLRPYFHSHHLGPHQLSIKASPSKARCFRSFIEVGNRAEPIRDRVSHKPNEWPEEAPSPSTPQIPKWGLYVDGSSNDGRSGASLILVRLKGHRMHCTLKFRFKASNNEAEYEALIVGLKLAKEMKVESLEILATPNSLFVGSPMSIMLEKRK